MLNGKELGRAIEKAYKLKEATGAVSSKADVARHFGIRTPSIYDWFKKGSIGKEKLPELFRFFSDVVGHEHWGMSEDEWPAGLSCPVDVHDSKEESNQNLPPTVATIKPATERDAWLAELSSLASQLDLPRIGMLVQRAQDLVAEMPAKQTRESLKLANGANVSYKRNYSKEIRRKT